MVVVRIQKIIWDEFTIDHIKKHRVTVSEVEKVIYSDAYEIDGHSGKKILVNRVRLRIISVVVLMKGNKLTIVTARDSNKDERKGLYEHEKNLQEKI